MSIRNLTGNWYLKKNIFGRYSVMVEVEVEKWDDTSYGNGGGSYAPLQIYYEKAKPEDLIELEIKVA